MSKTLPGISISESLSTGGLGVFAGGGLEIGVVGGAVFAGGGLEIWVVGGAVEIGVVGGAVFAGGGFAIGPVELDEPEPA